MFFNITHTNIFVAKHALIKKNSAQYSVPCLAIVCIIQYSVFIIDVCPSIVHYILDSAYHSGILQITFYSHYEITKVDLIF